MKRYGMIFALLFAGAIAFAANGKTAVKTDVQTFTSAQPQITETEKRILKLTAPLVKIAYTELLDMHAHGLVAIGHLGGNSYRVTVQLADGGTVLGLLEDHL
ncbi:MAG: hypothetical protein AAGN35_16340 [Bacteroidota bacterium]